MPTFAFWNLENLFAPENHPGREPWIADAVASDLAGWTQALFEIKLSQLTQAISAMADSAGPDVLGICEVENRFVLDELVALLNPATGRNYDVVHADSQADHRGIDTGFIYDADVFDVVPNTLFSHFVMRRTGTRDITQITFRSVAGGHEIVALANHWPSRSGGATIESAGFRAVAGETLAYWHERIREEVGTDMPIIAMGDLNDEPWDNSVKFNANATRERGDVERARSARFYNLAWTYASRTAQDHQGGTRVIDGTLYYDNDGNLFDQILINRSLLNGDRHYAVDVGSADIFAFPPMVDHRVGRGPRPFGLPEGDAASNVDQTGFSDHFPVTVEVDVV
ncbi:MAG: endonuclease/exonuclease/phosphatase family protein [Gammaproteobacteria bacterium]